jgi:hypothetical protein
MQVKKSLVIKNRGAIIHIIAISTSLSDSAEMEREWNMIHLATSHIPRVVSYDEKCKIQMDLRNKNISIFGDYILEIIPSTLV